MNKDYCTCFPEKILNIYIGDICKAHDNDVGEAGTYNPITPHVRFFNSLKERKIPFLWCITIAFGGAVLTWIKQPYFWYKIYKYRKKSRR
jgi:hypothetical protein